MNKPEKALAPVRDPAAFPANAAGVRARAPGPLVINLCSSNTPMTLVRPEGPELAKFTFFVSRRREEGRERFRLHMGYFESRAEAEQLLAVVREVYPAAWVGDAPGQNLRPDERSPKNAASEPATPLPARPTAAAPKAAAAPPAVKPPTVPAVKPVAAPAARPATPPVAKPVAAAAAKPVTPPAARPGAAPASNVREVLARLDGAVPAAGTASPAIRRPVAVPEAPKPRAAPAERLPTRAELEFELVAGGADQTDSQVLRVLETRRTPDPAGEAASGASARMPENAHRDIPLQRPQDTLSWREIRQQLAREANVSFALQLSWSTTPIDTQKVPALAIFEAYTLYCVEVTQSGQTLYGLRLGFFSDAMSAKQVAAYVRSEFLSVAVMPITMGERDHAQRAGGIHLTRPPAPVGKSLQAEEITLINELTPPRARATADAPVAPPAAPARPAAQPVRASRPRGRPRTLEETLEILGASQLSIDSGKGERINMGSRGRSAPDKRTSTFSKLLDRLSVRLKP